MVEQQRAYCRNLRCFVRALALRLLLDHTPEVSYGNISIYKVSILVFCVLYVFGVAKNKHHSFRRILGRSEILHTVVPG